MNPKLSFLFNRRSVRKYESNDIPDDVIIDLLEGAMAAPSAMAKDPWRFIVIRNRETLDRLTAIMPNAQMLREAPVGIIVCGDLGRAHERLESYMLQDCSAATENLLLAATALGLGSCWLGIHPRKERIEGVREIFTLPDRIVPVSGVALGWPVDQPAPRTRFKTAYVHRETWTTE